MAAALPPFADVVALSDWLGEPISEPADIKRAEGVLRLASTLVRHETGKSWTNETGILLNPLPDALSLVTIQAAARAYSNPEGLTSESVDDAQVSRKVEGVGVYLTTAERDLLASLAGRPHRGLGTVRTSRGDFAPFDDACSWWVNGPDIPPDAS